MLLNRAPGSYTHQRAVVVEEISLPSTKSALLQKSYITGQISLKFTGPLTTGVLLEASLAGPEAMFF